MLLKDLYSKYFLETLAAEIKNYYEEFDKKRFLTDCLDNDWSDLKLMERSDRIVISLHKQLPDDFKKAAVIIERISPKFTGLAAVCLPNYVAKFGLDDWQTSMDLLAILTSYSSAEFAIRPFLIKYPAMTSRQMLQWSMSTDVDLRRLSSEGMRPRLPWGIRLQEYVKNPSAIIPILENLIFDQSEYVQKSVANNLNDISKDNPQQVIEFAQKYWNSQASSDWIIKHGLRTLFKQGEPIVLNLLGYSPQAANYLSSVVLTPKKQEVNLGEITRIHYQLDSTVKNPMAVYLSYRIHYVRQNKTNSFKDFFIKRTLLKDGGSLTGDINVKWRQLTTRRLYPGIHRIELLVNTQVVKYIEVTLN